MALPSGKTSKVKSIVTYDGELDYAFPPQCVTITLEDEIDVSRGEMLVHPDNLPIADRNFEAMLVWMDEEPMDASKQFCMIIDRVDARDMVTEDALAVLNLPELGIGPEHYEAIRSVCKELERQGVSVKCITENK